MASKKDMRRADLGRLVNPIAISALLIRFAPVIPYVEPKDDKPADFGSTITSTMPMAAV